MTVATVRTFIFVLCLINICSGVAVAVATWWYIGLLRLRVIGKYSGMLSDQIIDVDMVRQTYGDRAAEVWYVVPDEIILGAQPMRAAAVGYLASCVMFLTGILLLGIFIASRRAHANRAA